MGRQRLICGQLNAPVHTENLYGPIGTREGAGNARQTRRERTKKKTEQRTSSWFEYSWFFLAHVSQNCRTYFLVPIQSYNKYRRFQFTQNQKLGNESPPEHLRVWATSRSTTSSRGAYSLCLQTPFASRTATKNALKGSYIFGSFQSLYLSYSRQDKREHPRSRESTGLKNKMQRNGRHLLAGGTATK